jgi:predicted phage terminase large subunit-like protein
MYNHIANSLGAFASVIVPDMQLAKHHQKMINCLRRVEAGEITRLIITAPPRHTKSLLVAECMPPWFIGRRPDRQVIYSTYGDSLSRGFGRRVKGHFQSDIFKKIFPKCELRGDSQAADSIETKQRGVYTATSIGGSVTGKGAHLLIVDDYCKDRQEADSPLIRDRTWDWYTSTARTRLMPGGAVIVMATRWHEDDLIGRIMDKAKPDEWHILHLPAIDEEGNALWPEWYPLADLHAIRRDIGDYDFESLYQGNPIPKKGGILKTDRMNKVDELFTNIRNIQAVDTAVKIGQENDNTAIATMSYERGRIQIHDVWKGKVEYPDLKKQIKLMADRYSPSIIGIEDKASGQQILQEMKSLPLLPLKANVDKKTRAQAFAEMLSTGRVYVPKDAPWLDDLLLEMKAFPSGKHDDMIDAIAHGCNILSKRVYSSAFEVVFSLKKNVIDVDFKIPSYWYKHRSMEYPNAVIWWTIVTRNHIVAEVETIIILDEMKIPDGTSPERIAIMIKDYERENGLTGVESGPAGGSVDLFSKNGPRLSNVFLDKNVSFIPAFDEAAEGLHHIKMKFATNKLLISRKCENLIDEIFMATVDDNKLESPGHFLKALQYVCHSYTGGGIGEEKVDVVKQFKDMEDMFMGRS